MKSFPEKIGFYSSIAGAGTYMGYGYVGVELIHAWQSFNVPVWWMDQLAPVSFSFVQPHWYEYENKDRVNIGYTPWESSVVPEAWLYYMEQMTEIWTPSQCNKEWFEQAGLTRPIRVLPHGINREHWPLKKRQREDKFVWLHVGGESKRKGAQMVYDAFIELFANQDDVVLVLKGDVSFETNESNVHIIRERLDQVELTKLYLNCHAMAYPTNGEGFGLIPFQAAATGMPTLVTDWSAPQDYMKYCLPIKVQDLVEPDYEPHVGLWALPDQNNLVEKMWDITQERSDYFFDKAYRAGARMYSNYSWQKIARTSLDWMQELLET